MLGLFLVLDDFTKNILQCLGVGKNSYDPSILKIIMLINMDLYLESVQTYENLKIGKQAVKSMWP